MRAGIVISALVHLSVISLAVVSVARPFDVEPADGILVDLVEPREVPAEPAVNAADKAKDAAKPDEVKGEPKQAEAKAQDQGSGEPGPQSAATSSVPPSPAAPEAELAKLAALDAEPQPIGAITPEIIALPPLKPKPEPEPEAALPPPVGPPLASPPWPRPRPIIAGEAAKLTPEETAAFKAEVQKCFTPPRGVAATAKLRAVVRVTFSQDGRLAAEPALIAATASRLGPALVRAAEEAVRKCQPYATLPPAKFSEWRRLDLDFSPRGVSGG